MGTHDAYSLRVAQPGVGTPSASDAAVAGCAVQRVRFSIRKLLVALFCLDDISCVLAPGAAPCGVTYPHPTAVLQPWSWSLEMAHTPAAFW